MNWLDLVILIIVGVSAFLGLKIGLIRAGLTALGIFVGSILGGQFSDDIGGLFSGIDSDSAAATVISYAIIIEPKVWGRFIDHLIEIIRDVPISFPDLEKLDNKKQKIYDQISRNTIKPGTGVISLCLSNVDYDAAGAEGVGIVLCMIITTNDSTRIVVPFRKTGRVESAVT